MTTDYPAVQRGLEIGADVLLVAKNGVDGLYSADPRKDPQAKLIQDITYQDVIMQNLRVMDPAAFVLAREQNLPMHIFELGEPGRMAQICQGARFGTFIHG